MEANKMKAMREAVKHMIDTADSIAMRNPTGIIGKLAFHIKQTGDAALAEPPRNCDVGTAEEQAKRFYKFCMANSSAIRGMCDSKCLCIDSGDKCHCLTKWAQMPYEEGKTDGSK